MKIFAPYLDSLLEYATHQNLDVNALKGILVDPIINLKDPREMISGQEYMVIFNKIIKAADNEYCGLNFGCYLNMGALGLVLEISLSTSSIIQGVYILQNFLDNKFPLVSASIEQDSEHFILQLNSSVSDFDIKRNLLDMVLSIVYRELKLMLPTGFEPSVKLPFTDSQPYLNLLKTEIAFNTNYQLILPIEVVKKEINNNRVKEIELLLPKFLAMLNANKEDNELFSSQIRSMTLHMCAPEIPNFEQVQKQFPYSKRTIQRKLTLEGTSFRDIVNTIKEELSNYLINEKHLKTKDVAHILGYSESSAYLHAVKSWSN
ncbi:AraC family transcriptional regulator ligand-binding domain-containing protein [Hyunsoonleella pacifica]|uniref:HTH-type transcriptional regulator AraC-type N-terminal domain-containing protein n=1 Tax=Hyunsoonleella pacifica TaxID=1080224 RepID=A0A4Q9FSB4_9FLAO|nr:AraC family transcriptional regulator ligand-binding domain-containing protein [Hyunsoonleella pacifica]TBN18706.1 hypothetical protein EYD46_01170 [Hyunsoonleella pacifica]GGD04028.1 putative HTH-type transcriptional regulator [Hyunsoonleella pacifica]